MARYTKDENGNLILTAGGTRTWIVTQAAHDRAVSAGTAPNNCLVAITDDYLDNEPLGIILAYGGTTAPTGWLLCQGQAVSRTDYADLFAVIGTAFGSGDGSTTFNVPDLREATTKGVGLTGKSSNHYDSDSDGVALGEFVEDRIKSHQHTITSIFAPGSVTVAGTYTVAQTSKDMLQVAPAGASTNEVKAVGVNYIIKAKHA